ncbi:MAG: hypothetical protein ACJA1A_001784 [Saprospiraceae bacterium]|jgi:hypothetical protein|tara:strand:- start:252 stop:797 length:546 start_codon:yes stop_codon:yes gene_type:complete
MNKLKVLLTIAIGACCVMSCSTKRVIIEDEIQRAKTIDILVKYELNGIKVNYDMLAMESADTGDMYSYLESLDLAIESFLTDGSYPESPLGIVPDAVKSYKGNVSKPQQHKEKLIEMINSGGSLCMPDIDGAAESCFHAEEGENVEQNWIFLLLIPELSDHHFWAIVPKGGEDEVYNYGFK